MLTQKELAMLFKEYHAAKVAADKAKSLSTKIKDAIRDKGKDGVDAGGYHASVSQVSGSMRFDEKRFKAEHPDIWAEYLYKAADTERLNFK